MHGSVMPRARADSGETPRLCLIVLLISALASRGSQAAERDRDPFQGDLRLQKAVTIRVSRMPVADLLQRLGRELGVPLTAEGDDVGGQRIDLFTHGNVVSAAEILTAISRML